MKNLSRIFPVPSSFKRQIVLTFAAGFFILSAAFVAYLVQFESDFLYSDSNDRTTALARSLAVSSRSWVLADDVVGLQEVVNSVRDYPGLQYAMIVSPSGRVLAHTDASKSGQFVTDAQSRTLIGAPSANRVMRDEPSFIDIAVPIVVNEQLVGWARIGQAREFVTANLSRMIWRSAFFILNATALALLAAFLIARRLGYRIGSLVQVAEEVQAGNFNTRANIAEHPDEITQLADSFNRMLDAQAQSQKDLQYASRYTRSLIEASLDPLVTISAEGKINDVNQATEAVTGRNRAELIRTDFSDYFTEPDKAREGYQQVFQKGFVTDYPLAIRHKDGHITDVLYNASIYRNESGEVSGVFAAARDVTERNKAEAALRKSESLLQATMKILPVGLWIADATGKLVFGNDKGKQIWAGEQYVGIEQYSEYKGWGLGSGKLLGPHDWGMARAVEKGEISIEEEIEIECFDGSHKIIFNSALPLRRSDGSISGAIGINQDITSRKQTELEREQYYKFFNTATDLMGIADPNGTFKKINPAFVKMLGYSEAEILSKPFIDFVHPDDRQPTLDEMARQLQNGFSLNFENRYVCKDGSFRWLSWKASVNYDEGLTYATARDITENKKAQEQLQRSKQGLSEAQRIAHLGNWELDLVSNVLTWSDEIYRIFEIDPEKFGASYEAFLNGIHPADRELVNNAYTESVKNKKAYDIAHRLLMQDGRIKYVLEKCETHYAEDGKPLRSVGTVHDITELKEAEDKINEFNRDLEQRVAERTEQLEAANKELEAFSYSVSHDLRTPLRAIDGFSHILLDDYADKLDAEGKRLLNVVRNNTSRMGQLIDDILKFSRTGRAEINLSEIDMEGMARAVVEELQSSVADSKLQLEIEPIPKTNGDSAMMRQIFVNLLSNAIKFSRNRETPKIKVGGSIAGDEATYYVKDNGVGFDMQYADKLFGVFQRLHSVDEFEGTGIGLAIVKRIVTRHGGRVWAEGKVNEGATIYFALPIKENNHE